MAGFIPAIHVRLTNPNEDVDAGTSPAMTSAEET
jgi:hypothetical protein